MAQNQKEDNLDKRIKELSIEHDALNLKVAKLMIELGLKHEQVKVYLSNPENFSEKNWTEIENTKKELNEKLLNDLLIISKGTRKKKTQSTDTPKPHWVMMR